MRPKKLTISAWGPYPGREEIDFDRVSFDGLFLITGPTGSGKTTIFDAVSYALYGVVSGKSRERVSVRSDFAAADTPTFVTLEFSHRGAVYMIRRSPKYQRPKKRGKGEIQEPEKAELRMPDGREYSQVLQVNAQMNELLGMNHEQFKQVSMIAQGEFLELLTADSAKRVEIFRNLFGTGIFNRVQQLLAERSRDLENEIRDLNHRMEEARAGILFEGNEALAQALSVNPVNDRGLPGLLEADLAEHEEQLRDTVDAMGHLSDHLQALRMAASNVEKANQELLVVRDKLQEYEKEGIELAARRQVHEEAWKQREERNRQETWLTAQIEGYTEQIRWCRDFALQKKEYKRLEDQCRTKEKELACVLEQESGYKQVLQTLEKELENMQDTRSLLMQTRHELENRELETKDAQAFVRRCRTCEDTKQQYEKSQQKAAEAESAYRSALLAYEDAQQASRMAAAGLLAAQLAEGKPCPVCGSCEHPHPAGLAGQVPDEQTLKKLKRKSEKANQSLMDIWQETVHLRATFEALETDLREAYEKALPEREETEFSLQKVLAFSEERCTACQTAQEEARNAYISAQEKDSRRRQLEEDRADCKEDLQVCQEKKEKCQAGLVELQMETQSAKGRMEEAGKRMTGDEETLTKKKQAMNRELEALKSQRRALEKEHQELTGAMASNETLIASSRLEEQRLSQVRKDAQAQYTDLCTSLDGMQPEELQNKLQALQELRDRQTLRLSHNRQAKQSIEEKLARQEKLAAAYGTVRDLDLAARGNNEQKITFEQYVLSAYFDEVLQAANLRLELMSHGRYEMVRTDRVTDRRRTNGLDIEVMDFYTGKKRSVRTLSGGESFNAALSLALGLSDVIQSHAGGMEIEALFIDEGFGSLDEMSLQSAVDTLTMVATDRRMTGIISHVQELKERITHQIVIEKQRCGSSVRIVQL